MNIKTTLKASVAVAALFAVAVPVAEAGTVSNSNKFDVNLSGQLNKALYFYDNGTDEGAYVGDNGGAQSRARIVATGKINEALSVVATTEWKMTTSDEGTLDPATTQGFNGTEGGSDSFFAVRHNNIALAHKQLGTLTLGHASDATDGMTEFGGLGNVGYGQNNLFGGSVSLVNSATKARVTGISATSSDTSTVAGSDIGAYRVSADGGRTTLIKYTTPTLAGVSVSVAHSNEQSTDVSGKFSGKFGDFGISAGVGYKNSAASSDTVDSQMMGGAAVSHSSGLSVDFNFSRKDMLQGVTYKPKSYSGGIVYKTNLTSMGSTAFRVGYSQSKNAIAAGDKLVGWVVGVEQGVADGVTAYAGWQNDDVSAANSVNYDDVTTIFAGTKVVF